MRYIFLFIAILIVSFSAVSAQEMEVSPFKATHSPVYSGQFTEDQWDVQFNYDGQAVTGALGSAGAEFTGTNFYTTRWSRNMIQRWNADGTLRDSFAISGYTGASGIRDLAWDGQYIYGGVAAGLSIVKIDTGTRAVVSIITSPVNVRSIAYDPVLDGFWVSDWAGNIVCVSRTGTTLATITTTLAAKYGSAYDPYSPDGPYLWVWDQGQGQGFPQIVHQFSLATLAPTGVTFDILTKITDGGATAIAGGLFITGDIVSGKATLGGLLQGAPDRLFGLELTNTSSGPLNPFNLTSPDADVTVSTLPGSSTEVMFAWDTAAAGATYKFVFGTALPTRLFSLSSSRNSLTVTLGQLDGLLADAGVAQGDSLIGAWDVWAYRNNAPDNDTLSSENGPRNITLKRAVPALTSFNLLSPVNGSRVITSVQNGSLVSFVWSASGEGTTYQWKFGTPTIATPVVSLASNGNGTATTFSSVNSALDAMLGSWGLNPGDSVNGQWAVWAYGAGDSLQSTETFDLTFKRQARGDVLVVYDSTLANGRTSRDSIKNNLDNMGITYDVQNRGGNTSTITFTMLGYSKVIWLGEATSTSSLAQRDSIKSYLNAGGSSTSTKSKLIIFSEDFGWQHGRTGSTNIDLDLMNNYLGINFVADRPTTGANQGIVGVAVNGGQADSTVGTWPDVLESFPSAETAPLYQFRGRDSLNAIANYSSNFNVATFGVDIRSLRPAIDSPPGSPATRLLTGGLNAVDEALGTEDNVKEIPLTFELMQNYPNPFNPSTSIEYALPQGEFVSLKIFDVLGREVATLVNEVQSLGFHSVNFDAGKFSSGVYFYKIQAGKFVSTKKMLLMK